MSHYAEVLAAFYLVGSIAFGVAYAYVMHHYPKTFDRLDNLDGSQPVENDKPNTWEVSA